MTCSVLQGNVLPVWILFYIFWEVITHATEHGHTAHVVLLDAKRAFDTMWIEGLFYLLRNLKMNKALWWTLRSYYTDFTYAMSIGGNKSRKFNVSQRVYQGTVTAMIL